MSTLIDSLPQYLGRDPGLLDALRLTAPTEIAWSIARDRLMLDAAIIDLTQHTLSSLIDTLQAGGWTLDWFDGDALARGAVSLAEGSGSGTEIVWSIRTSILHSLTVPIQHAWLDFADATPQAAAQVDLPTAEEEWLDVHGVLYGVPRRTGMDDVTYRAHILAEVLRPRNTPLGMVATVARWTGYTITIQEPWQGLLTLSESALSDDYYFQAPLSDQFHTFRAVGWNIPPAAWVTIDALLDADRPAGTIRLPSVAQPPITYLAGIGDPMEVYTPVTQPVAIDRNTDPSNVWLRTLSSGGDILAGRTAWYWDSFWDARLWVPPVADYQRTPFVS